MSNPHKLGDGGCRSLPEDVEHCAICGRLDKAEKFERRLAERREKARIKRAYRNAIGTRNLSRYGHGLKPQ